METTRAAIELKGNLVTMMVLRLQDVTIDAIQQQLADKVAQSPNFFRHAPLVLDLQLVQERELDFAALLASIRQHDLMPVAVKGGSEAQIADALKHHLGILPSSQRASSRPIEPPVESKKATAAAPPSTRVITQPVRSGQQIVEMQGDLVILGAVSPGAEVLAQRHIHVYGALRGRALAGVTGDTQARIFCQQMDAELVSIAGNYQINDDLEESIRQKAVQVYLDQDEHLQIQTL